MTDKIYKIAIISDIHGNLQALNAVLTNIKKHRVKQIWNLGDAVGNGGFSNNVVEKLHAINSVNVIGNYDLKVLSFDKNKAKWKKTKSHEKYHAFKSVWENLKPENRNFLKTLPEQLHTKEGNIRFLLTHGGPAAVDEYINDITTKARLKQLAEIAETDVILFGHTHKPFFKKAFGVWFINPGSVGKAENSQGKAEYTILEIAGHKIKIHEYLIDYQKDELKQSDFSSSNNVDYGSNKNKILKEVRKFAQKCNYDQKHAEQVTRLSLQLFDGLKQLHKLSKKERFLLHCGAILHDIGWIEGQKSHNKTSLNIILKDNAIPFKKTDRVTVALLARYHRKAVPAVKHKYYRNLKKSVQNVVKILSAILRIADGLDCTHRNIIESVKPNFTSKQIFICCKASGSAEHEILSALQKGDLIQSLYGKKLLIKTANNC